MADPKAFVCGHPIKHSRSPLIHRFWLKELGLAGDYTPVDVAPKNFAQFIAELQRNGYAGGNVTLPHKEAAAQLADHLTPEAQAIGAANTLWFEGGALWAGNTDAYGFAANLDQRAPGWDRARTACVLGAGGAARAIIYALQQRGLTEIRVLNRTLGRAQELAQHFGALTHGCTVTAHELADRADLFHGAGLVINTTSLGLAGSGDLPANPSLFDANTLVTDIVYVPLETPFLAAARARGLMVADGLGMLLHQAVPGFERWFGRRPDVSDALRARIIADMEAHT